MRTYDCPQCGATVPFQSSVTVSTTCAFCRSVVVRKDGQVETMGIQAELPPDLSPIQIGTTGTYQGRAFVIVGRVRIAYNEGAWNEWCADFGEGLWGWIAEAQGFYMASFELAVPEDFPGAQRLTRSDNAPLGGLSIQQYGLMLGRESLPAGRGAVIQGIQYTVRDSKLAHVVGCDGELPFVVSSGRTAWSADLEGPERRFANAEFSEDGIRLYAGHFLEFHELGFDNLRPVPGWTADAATVRHQTAALNCPQCGATVLLRAAGFTVTAVCASCGTGINTASPTLETIRIAAARQSYKPLIPLGSRGRFEDRDFECIAYIRKTDSYGETWSEYLLFNPFTGFRWLVTFNGHWTFVRTLLESPMPQGTEQVFEGKDFKLFSRGQAHVSFVLGEVYWRMRVRERTVTEDYISPPFVLSAETYPDLHETTWSAGEYISPETVRSAFQLPEPLREPVGPYLNAPNPHREQGARLRRWVPVFIALAVFVQLFFALRASRQTLVNAQFVIDPSQTNQVHRTPEFEIPGSQSQSVVIETVAPLNNAWLELDCSLVDQGRQQVEEFLQSIEYYSGWDEGAWTEGSQTEETVLSAVKPGRYTLLLDPTWDPSKPPPIFQVRVTRDVPLWSNLWIALAALISYPTYRWARETRFENARWEQSDFAASDFSFNGSEDEDEDDSVGLESISKDNS